MPAKPNRNFLALGGLLATICFAAPPGVCRNNFLENPNQPLWQFSPAMDVPHIAWAKPYAGGPLRATVIGPRLDYRDTAELCQRLSLEVVPIITNSYAQITSPDHFDYYPNLGVTDSAQWLEMIREQLRKPADVLIIGKVLWTAFPPDIRATMVAKVRGGCGLLYINPALDTDAAGSPALKLLLGDVGKDGKASSAGVTVALQHMAPGHSAARNLTGLALPQLEGKDWPEIVYTGSLGQGRVLAVDYAYRIENGNNNEAACRALTHGGGGPYSGGSATVFHHLVGASHAQSLPCAYEYLMGFLAKSALWCGKREPAVRLDDMALEGGKTLQVRIKGGPVAAGIHINMELRDGLGATGAIVQQWDHEAATIPLPALRGGTYFVNAWLRDANGNVLDWGSLRLEIPEPPGQKFLHDITCAESTPRIGQPIRGEVNVGAEWPAGDMLRLSVMDNFGRCLWQHEIPAAAQRVIPYSALCSPGRSVAVTVVAERLHSGAVAERIDKLVCFSGVGLDGDFVSIVWSNLPYDDRVTRQDLSTFRAHQVDAMMYVSPSMHEACLRENFRLVGQTMWLTGEQVHCFSDPAALKMWGDEARKVASQYQRFSPLALTYGDEVCYERSADGKGVASDLKQPYSNDAFREFLGSLYNPKGGPLNLARLNAAWGTNFKDAGEIKVRPLDELKKTDSRAQWMCEALLVDWLYQRMQRQLAAITRETLPDTYCGDEGTHSLYSGNGHDYYRLFQDPGLGLAQLYDTWASPFFEMSFAQAHSLRGMWTGNYGYYLGEVDDEWMRLFPWRSLFYGMNSAWWWEASLALTNTGKPIPCFAAYAAEIAQIKRGPATLLLQVAKRSPTQVGVVFSPNTINAYTFEHQASGPHPYALATACQGLIRAGYSFKLLHQLQLDDGKELAAGYKALVLPAVIALSDAQLQTIREFVRQGGTLIADQAPDPYFNELGIARQVDPFRSVFSQGANVGEYTFGSGKAFFLKEPFGLSLQERYVGGDYGRNNNTLGPTYVDTHKQTLAEMFRMFIESGGGCKPPVSVTQADGKVMEHAEISTFTDGPALYVGIARQGRYWEGNQMIWKHWDGYQEKTQATIQFQQAAHIYDVMAGQYLGYGASAEVELASAARLFAALPSKIDGIAVSGVNARYNPGAAIEMTADLKVMAATGHTSVLHVSIRRPGGQSLPCFEQNCLAPKGSASCCIPLALDEAPGPYELVVADVASGVNTAVPFRIE